MLRISILFENRLGRNDGNPLYVWAALKRLEKEGKLLVDHMLPDGNYSHFGKYDANIVVDWGEDGLTSLLPYSVDYNFGEGLKVYWASDTHIHDASYQYRLETARKFDIVFCAQKRAVEEFKRDGVEAIWLPHAVEPLAYNDEDDPTGKKPYEVLVKKHDVCFVGHVNNQKRIEALDRLFKEFPNFFYGQRLFNEAAKKYAESKVCFNIAMTDDINMRCFEVLGSKSFLITDRIPTIEELFVDGKHLVLYDSLNEMVDKARYYINCDEERQKIAESGYKHVMANHTIDNRVETILNAIQERLNATVVH